MITPDSRYAAADKAFAQAHDYDVLGAVVKDENDRVIVNNRDTVYYIMTAPDQNIPPHLYMAKETDHISLLAYRTLQDPTKWWQIADVNLDIRYPLDIAIGTLMHLPA